MAVEFQKGEWNLVGNVRWDKTQEEEEEDEVSWGGKG